MTTELRHGSWWDRWKDGAGRPSGAEAFEGRFVRYFDESTVSYPDAAITALAEAMTSPPEGHPTPEGQVDPEENRGTSAAPGIPAAYTYFGQFIDHDLTLDPTSSLRGKPLSAEQLSALVDFRTPRFDLDCLYGRGPSDQPYLYQSDGLELVVGAMMSGNPHDQHATDVPRGPNGRALIGDPRNDENRIVAQLQSTMLRFHNAMVSRALKQHGGSHAEVHLPDIQQQVRWHYQWAIMNDFLPTIVQAAVLEEILGDGGQPRYSIGYLRDLAQSGQPLQVMPVEFSVAAYRFGHSMIRPIYRINQSIERRQIFSTSHDLAGDLGGMRPIPSDWALDWQYFIDIDHHGHHDQSGDDPLARTPQFSYKIDTSLVSPLAHLPAVIAANPASLAERNLLRGLAFSLPTGEEVAAHLGVQALTPEQILIGKATTDPADERSPISQIGEGAFAGKTPLWTYVLAEAWQTSWQAHPEIADKADVPIKLGPVGGHLVAETITAVLHGDPNSYVHQPAFAPDPELCHDGAFGLAELIGAALHHG